MARTIVLALMAIAWPFLILGGAAAAPPQLGLPIDCTLGRDCFIQSYVDAEPGEGVRDYNCGEESYEGHKGTDIRIRSVGDVEKGVAVVAAAAGTVAGVRDGMADRLLRSDADRKAVADKECGNGVLIEHGDGWQTQYCHMRKGSVTVAAGDKVERGDRIGEVGYSGMAAFPHVHLEVRRATQTIDPFTGAAPGKASCNDTAGSLWAPEAAALLAYREGDILQTGFLPEPPTMEKIEDGMAEPGPPRADWPVLVAWGWAINLRAGDKVEVILAGPTGELARNAQVLERKKAQSMLFAGVRRPAGGWPAGRYIARFQVVRGDKPALSAEMPVNLD